MALNDVIARLAVHLGLETAAFEKGTGKAKREVTGLERHVSKAGLAIKAAFVGMFGALAVDQIVQVAKAGLEYASSLGEVASQLGVTTKALQEYRYAASQAGIEQGEMDQALSQLTRRLGDAAQGSKSINAAFDRLGVSIRDANGHVIDAGDAIPLIADGLQKIESPAERAAILVDLFGKAGQKLAPLLEGGSAGVNDLREAAQKLGIVLSEKQIQDADETADKLSALKQVLEAKIAGAVTDNTQSILDLVDALTKLVEYAGKAAKAWRYFSDLDWSWNAPSFSKQFEQMQLRDLGPGVELTDSVKAEIRKRKDARFLAPSGGNLLRTPPKFAPRAPLQTPWGPLVQPGLGRRNAVGSNAFGGGFGGFEAGQGTSGWMRMAAAAPEVGKWAEIFADRAKLAEISFSGISDDHAPRLLQALRDMKPELEALRSQTQGILDRLFPDEAEARRYAEELAILNTALQKGQISLDTHAKAVLALRREYDGFGDAVQEAAQIISTEFGPTLDEISDAISDRLPQELGTMANDAQTATVRVAQSFADMAESIASSLGNLIGGKAGGIFSSLISIGLQFGRAGAFGSGVTNWLNKIPAFANGTRSAPGGLSLVGERGPELVDLPRGSRVIPNNKLTGMGGSIAAIVPSPYFDVVVDGRVLRAGPGFAEAGAARAHEQSAFASNWKLA